MVEHTDREAGFNLQYPESWVVDSLFGQAVIAEDWEMVEECLFGEEPKACAFVSSLPLDDLGIDAESLEGPADLLGIGEFPFIELFEKGAYVELEISGYPAISVSYTAEDEEDLDGYMVLILAKEIGHAAFFCGFASPERWEEGLLTFEVMATSLNLFEPQIMELELPTSAEDLGEKPFVNQDYGHQIAYPDGWLISYAHGRAFFSPHTVSFFARAPIYVDTRANTIEKFLDGDLIGLPEDQLVGVMEMVAEADGMEMDETEELDLNGVPALGAELSGVHDDGTLLGGYIVLASGDTRAAVIVAITPADAWEAFQPVFAAMLKSFAFLGN